MRKTLAIVILVLGALTAQAQEKVMNIQKTDGTTTQTRVADLKEMSFLTVEEGGKGLMVKTMGGETTAVLFETNPVVTVSNGKLTVKSTAAEAVQFEITDIAEILFGDASNLSAIHEAKGFACVLQDGAALLRGIPKGAKPRIYTLDGHSMPTPALSNGELRLSRATLGTGVYIVKVGAFSTKIKF